MGQHVQPKIGMRFALRGAKFEVTFVAHGIVRYAASAGGNPFKVATSRIAAMLRGDAQAKEDVNAAVFLKKAADWKYEKEWRHLGLRGVAASPFELTDITFGLRCPAPVKHAVMRAFEGRKLALRFYEIHENSENFSLKRYRVDADELARTYPNRALDTLDMRD